MDNQVKKLQGIFEIINYIFAGISLICSLFVIYITSRNKKLFSSINNLFVHQLLYSEIINNLTQLSSIFMNVVGTKEEKYDERMRICYSQIFTGLFANFYCLSSTLLISFHLYDLFLQQGRFFSVQRNVRLCRIASFYSCLIISYIIFVLQMNTYQNYSYTKSKVRMISCWVSQVLDWVTCSIFVVLILITCGFAWQCYEYIKKYSQTYLYSKHGTETETDDEKKNQKIRINSMQKRLRRYPIVNIIVFTFLIVHRVLTYILFDDDSKMYSVIAGFILFTIPTCIRGLLYMLVYFGMQQMFVDEMKRVFCCCGDEFEGTDMTGSSSHSKTEKRTLKTTPNESSASVFEEEEDEEN